MPRLYLFAEGWTEQTFASTVLGPHVDGAGSPELVDDGRQTAPSKRIIEQFPDYEYRKATVGPQAAERIGLATIRCKCRHFAQWLERLERLG